MAMNYDGPWTKKIDHESFFFLRIAHMHYSWYMFDLEYEILHFYTA